MTKLLHVCALLFFLISAPLWARSPHRAYVRNQIFTIQKLRTYCNACHGLGNLRFIRSDDDTEVWDYLFKNKAPTSGKWWSDAIIEVLNWPSDSPPPFDQMLNPPNKDWMPRGYKRILFSQDVVGSVSSRGIVVEALQRQLPDLKP